MSTKSIADLATEIAAEFQNVRAISDGTASISGIGANTQKVIAMAAGIAARRAIEADRAQRNEQLQRVEVIGPDGFGDPLIACTRCGTELCSIELDDTMETLARIAETHGGEPCIPPCPNCGEEPSNETEKRQGVEGFCASCVHNAIRSGWEPGQ